MQSNHQYDQIQSLAHRFNYWMMNYPGHYGSSNEELIDWLLCDNGAEHITSYLQFCLLAKKIEELGYKTNPPPTEEEYNKGINKYYRRLPHHKAQIKKNLANSESKSVTSLWYRTGGDFYENIQGSYTVNLMVEFRNTNISGIIKQISILRSSDKKKGLRLTLSSSPFRHNELLCLSKIIFQPHEYEESSSKILSLIRIEFNNIESFNKIIMLFHRLNKNSSREEIPREIITEITNIADYLHGSHKIYTHIIDDRDYTKVHINPDRSDSQEIINLMNQNQRKSMLTSIKVLLSKGEDPNQEDLTGRSALYLAVCHYDIQVIQIMLVYGANPFKRDNYIKFESAMEKAKLDNKVEIMALFITNFTKPQKTLSSPKITNLNIFENNNIIITKFEFNTQLTIQTYLKPVALLKEQEKDQILDLFLKMFYDPEGNTDNVKKIFEEDFHCDESNNKKLIEIIRELDKKTGHETIIGFNLFSIILNITSNPAQHVVICEYSGLEKTHRRIGIGFILLFRVAFSLQPLVDAPISVHFSAINYNSYRLVEDLLHSPKYQPEHEKRSMLLNTILKDEYKDEIIYYYNSNTAFIFDSLSVNSKLHSKSIGLDFFEQEILGISTISSQPKNYTRGGLILVDVADEFFYKIFSIAITIGFNFLDHMQTLAELLSKITNINEKKPVVYKLLMNYPYTRSVFWNPSKNKIPKTVNLSHLARKHSHL